VCTTASTYTITKKNILQLYVMAATAVTSFRLWRSARVISVEIWNQPIALGGANLETSVSGIGSGPENVKSSFASGVTPAHIRWSPVPLSQNGLWFETGTNENDGLFAIVLNSSQAVIDVTLEVIFADQFDGQQAGEVPAGAAAGGIYMDYLDGIASGKIAPVDFTTLP